MSTRRRGPAARPPLVDTDRYSARLQSRGNDPFLFLSLPDAGKERAVVTEGRADVSVITLTLQAAEQLRTDRDMKARDQYNQLRPNAQAERHADEWCLKRKEDGEEGGGGGGGMVRGLDYLRFGRQAACLLCAGGVGEKTMSLTAHYM